MALVLALGLVSWLSAQDEQALEFQRVVEESQRRELEELKATDPEAYRRTQEAGRRRASMQAVVARWRKGELSEQEAEKQLFPLAQEETRPEVAQLRARIERLERFLARLREYESAPDLLARQRAREMLGKPSPGDVEPF